MIDITEFFESVREYDKSASNEGAKGFTRCAIVDPAYAGTGPARVTFDGEESLSQKTYHFIGMTPPPAGVRVALLPIGSTYMILGPVNGGV